MQDPDLIVSRHEGLVGYLVEEGVVDADVERIEHAKPDDVRGKHVVGNLPSRLAAEAALLTEVDLKYPEDYRGEKLDADEVRECSAGLTTYVVHEAEDQLVE